jgi:hypothetical protein
VAAASRSVANARISTWGATSMNNLLSPELSSRSGAPYGAPSMDSLEPETLLPVQYNCLMRQRHVVEGEFKLMLAVLKDALRSYLRNMHGQTRQARRQFMEAYRWFHAEDQEGLFAYRNLCEALGLEPEPLRRWLPVPDGFRAQVSPRP